MMTLTAPAPVTITAPTCPGPLALAAAIIAGRETATWDHLEACPHCRESLIAVGRVASGIDACVFFANLPD